MAAKKKAWLTWMPGDDSEQSPNDVLSSIAKYGLEPTGAAWVDDMQKMAWSELGGQLLDPDSADAWIIGARKADLEEKRNRYALSLISAMLRENCERPFSVAVLGLDFAPTNEELPSLLQPFLVADARGSAWPAKLVAAVHGAKSLPVWDFRFNVIAHPLIGQWFEIGPREGEWAGAIFGVNGEGEIAYQAVGPAGELPERTVLEYPTQGIQAEVGGTEYSAWSVQNRITSGDSYYAKVDGHPERLLLGENPQSDDAEVATVQLV